MKITLVGGLPASGKTHLLLDYKSQGAIIIDDIMDINQLPEIADWLVISDVNYCIPSIRLLAKEILLQKYKNVQIEWVFFENNKDQCIKNAINRNNGRNVIPDIMILSQKYQIPENVIAIPVWCGN